MTSQNALDPDPFDWFFYSVIDFIIAASTEGKSVLKIVLKIVSKLFGFEATLSLSVTLKTERKE